MSYQDIDKEIAHLEVVFGLISPRDRFPLSYWQRRLHALMSLSLMPAQRERVVRLEAMLRSAGSRLSQVPETTRSGSALIAGV
ncbi:hypothetical protein LJ656_18820 [Paraburkholderia sp. MMS20-SJTR3]|uniref:Uncharacterized protein n=1 Tax=Paraburkholderia sejongensis TaxID=2886946 RepID=A0ABS8JXN7_9BURK|nr:hypothetical protein [Paraburkholderia sp. MMS20-SJTR3]MCC8394649.1 hypothetical protein [Paraburkholderia sp. MMS20-SJTR3]